MKRAICLLLTALSCASVGQSRTPIFTTPKPSLKTDVTAQQDVPTSVLVFKRDDPLLGVNASPLISMPVHCAPEGSLFLDMVQPANPNEHTFILTKDRQSRQFSVSSVPGLKNIQIWDAFPSSTQISFLVTAVKSETTDQGQSSYFIVEFGTDGAYKRFFALSIHYQLYHLGVLSNGQYVVAGYDNIQNVARLLLIDASGDVKQTLLLPSTIQNYGALNDPRESNPVMGVLTNIGSIQITAFADGILAWRAGAKDPLLVVGPNGTTREITAKVPTGYVLADVVSSTKNLLLHFEPQNETQNGSRDLSLYPYFEARASDGDLTRKLLVGGDRPAMIACESDGTYIAFATDDKGRLSLLRAR